MLVERENNSNNLKQWSSTKEKIAPFPPRDIWQHLACHNLIVMTPPGEGMLLAPSGHKSKMALDILQYTG